MLLKQTKIVASISDRRCDVDFIKQYQLKFVHIGYPSVPS